MESTSYKSVKTHIHGGAGIEYHLVEIRAVEVEIVFLIDNLGTLL